ncbi:MAG TPA: glycosyltransferase [Candidatus Paceibacterota bacterium]|nr:glycosyltransferase [Candidatus Paceibacterota bacterium]
MKKPKNVVIVSHKFLNQPDDDLVLYLNKHKTNNVLFIRHSFSDANNRCSYYDWYKDGKLYLSERTKDFKKCPEPIIYLKEIFYTYKWILKSKIKWDYCICMDGLLTFFTKYVNIFKKYNKLIFWVIDIVPEKRFKSKLKNNIYKLINRKACYRADEIWDLSPRMDLIRKELYGFKASDVSIHKFIQYGIWTGRIKKYPYKACEKNNAVFMGHLLEKQGVQLIIKAIPKIINKNPNFRLKIIGDGKYKPNLIELAQKLGVLKYCNFLGKEDNPVKLENEIAKSCIAIAPYIKNLDTWTYYADPGKIKKYIGSGVPVILTNVPWNAEEIEKNKCGLVIPEDEDELVKSIVFLMDSKNNQLYRNNAIKYSKTFDCNQVFEEIFK